MKQTLRSKTLSISISQSFEDVFRFLAAEENLPRWNRGFCRSIRKTQDRWILESPTGPASVRLIRDDRSGVIDQLIDVEGEALFTLPLRVLPNGDGVEVVLTIFQASGMEERDFQKLLSRADQGLRDLKRLLEKKPSAPASVEVRESTPISDESPASLAEEISSSDEAPLAPLMPPETPAEAPISGTRLYIGNLPYEWTDDQLREHFTAVAAIKEAEIARMGRRGRSRGFGFVEMENEEDAKKAIEQLHGSTAGTRRITVRFSKPKSDEPKKAASSAPAMTENRAPRSARRGRARSRPAGPPRASAPPRHRRPGPAPRRDRHTEPSAHIDQEEPVLETGGYYFVPRRRSGEDAPATEIETTRPQRARGPRSRPE